MRLRVWPTSICPNEPFFRYLIRVTISRRLADVVKDRDIWVHSFRMPPDINNSIKMEVGIEDCLHIEFEYNKSKSVFSHYAIILCPPFTFRLNNLLTGYVTRQVPSEGCHRRQDLFLARPHQDQAYGIVDNTARDDRCGAEPV